MPFQPGNQEAKKGVKAKLWRDAINRAIKRREADDPQAMEKLADKLLAKVAEGDVAAMKEFGDRVDGRVPQGLIGGDGDDPDIKVIHEIRRNIVDPRDTNSSGTSSAT